MQAWSCLYSPQLFWLLHQVWLIHSVLFQLSNWMHLCRTNNQKPQYKHTKVAGKFLEGDCWENIQKKPFGTNIIAFEINWPQQRRKRSLRTLFVSIMAAFASKTPGHNCTEGVGNSVGHIHRKHCKLYKDSLQNSKSDVGVRMRARPCG